MCLIFAAVLQESVRRQLKRGLELAKMNRMVTDTGIGLMSELRATDTSEDAARKRYRCAMPAAVGWRTHPACEPAVHQHAACVTACVTAPRSLPPY